MLSQYTTSCSYVVILGLTVRSRRMSDKPFIHGATYHERTNMATTDTVKGRGSPCGITYHLAAKYGGFRSSYVAGIFSSRLWRSRWDRDVPFERDSDAANHSLHCLQLCFDGNSML